MNWIVRESLIAWTKLIGEPEDLKLLRLNWERAISLYDRILIPAEDEDMIINPAKQEYAHVLAERVQIAYEDYDEALIDFVLKEKQK